MVNFFSGDCYVLQFGSCVLAGFSPLGVVFCLWLMHIFLYGDISSFDYLTASTFHPLDISNARRVGSPSRCSWRSNSTRSTQRNSLRSAEIYFAFYSTSILQA